MDAVYYKPEFAAIKIDLKKTRYPIKQIQDFAKVICGPFGSSIQVKDYQATGIPLVRIANIGNDQQLIKENIIFINEFLASKLRSYKVRKDDLVISQRGTLGLTAKIPPFFDGAIISANFIAIKELYGVSPEFLKIFLNSTYGQIQLSQKTSGQVQTKITTDDIKTLLVPIPPSSIQNQIIKAMESAYNQKKQKEAEARRLLASIDGYVLNELGIKVLELEDKKCFVVHSDKLNSILSPYFFLSTAKSKKDFVQLKSIAEINPSRKINNLELDSIVPYIGLPETDNFKVKNILERPYKEVKGRKIIKEDDILFARIEPSIFNKKYIFVNDLKGYDYAFTSTEFYIVKARKNINPEFLFHIFYTTPVYNQVLGKTTGSTGRRRLDKGIFEALLIPLPPLEIQNKIADEVKRRISKAERLKEEARKIIEEAKKKVEKMILAG